MAESLREAACTGNLLVVKKLLNNGVSVNSQNSMNGWTALHWACKRNHPSIIQFLLANGADANIQTFKGESATSLASSCEALNLLGSPLHQRMENLRCNGEELPIIPHYLQHPPFPYTAADAGEDMECPPSANSSDTNTCTSDLASNKKQVARDSSMDTDVVPRSLLLKIRVHGSGETDFLEIEVSPLSYQALLQACAEELEVDVSRIEKVRKLPNVLICKDHHMQRMVSGQELEVILNG